jgi:RNA polymerase sigma-70 factor (ECF subfamily)
VTDFARLATEQIPRLRRYARALVGMEQADDLVQDCLERAWSRRRLWDGQGNLRAWLFTIMHNLYANSVCRQVSAPAFEPPPGLPATQSLMPGPAFGRTPRRGPENSSR